MNRAQYWVRNLRAQSALLRTPLIKTHGHSRHQEWLIELCSGCSSSWFIIHPAKDGKFSRERAGDFER